MKITKAKSTDAESIANNNVRMAQESEGVAISFEDTLKAVHNLFDEPAYGFYLIGKEKSKVIAQLMITFEWSDWRNQNIWWIQSVYVDPSFRKKGVFSLLYNEVKKRAKSENVNILRLYVHENNKPAISVYEKIGMKKKQYLVYESSTE